MSGTTCKGSVTKDASDAPGISISSPSSDESSIPCVVNAGVKKSYNKKKKNYY